MSGTANASWVLCKSSSGVSFPALQFNESAARSVSAEVDTKGYKLGRVSGVDADGYQRVGCPAVAAKVRSSLHSKSMTLRFDRPTIVHSPSDPPICCSQQTITVLPEVNAKMAQKRDYPSAAHRRSYAQRTVAERTNATVKDPATTDVARGWCRVMGLVPMRLRLACALVARNQ